MSKNNSSPHNKDSTNEREITDPVTHLPLTIHDNVSVELEQIPPHPSNSQDEHSPQHHKENEEEDSNWRHKTLEHVLDEEVSKGRWYEPGEVERKTKIRSALIATCAVAAGGSASLLTSWLWKKILGRATYGLGGLLLGIMGYILLAPVVGGCVLFFHPATDQHDLGELKQAKPREGLVDEKKQMKNKDKDEGPESAAWLNSLLHSLWPVVNPALFTSIADMLEDALQATLPKFVHSVRVADIGQGSEPVRILGIRWLDAGKAGQDTDGMKAEEGDFINLELAFAYRAHTVQGSGLKGRSGNAHLLTEFLVVGGVLIPVWVELTGMIATARIRIQLTPNPPFLSLMTLTLLGQPKISMICTPLAKNFLNVMDVPGLSSWLQSSVDAAVSEYVAPRSLNLDLKTLLVGREKMDVDAVGVIIFTVHSGADYKDEQDLSVLESKKTDTYVTVGWSKLGKPLWIIQSENNPIWEETAAILVGPAEMNAQESFMLQLWDSDRMTADDLLGTVNVPLKDIMHESQNKTMTREDPLTSDGGSPKRGVLRWQCGYFSKTTLEQHLEGREQDVEELKKNIEAEAEEKLREAKARNDQTGEVEQQKAEDLKETTEEIIAGSRPTEQWPSGVLEVRMEQIIGLEVEKIRESGVKDDGRDEAAGDLPSAYCTLIINHQRVYKTRTKLKSDQPFFDAKTEKFLRDWRNTVVIIAVRDARLHENDPLLGVVVLPLHTIFKHKSHINDSFPLVGGIGYGRLRLSLTFRSVQAKLPTRLLGWDVGTLDIEPTVSASLDLPAGFVSSRLVFRTLYGKGKMTAHQDGGWRQQRGRNIHIAVKKRYSSCLLIEFRKHSVGADKTIAFATLWLKDILDGDLHTFTLAVYKNEDGALARARANAIDGIGERLGEVTVKLRLWPGLSGYHQNLADKDKNTADVMEALDCAEESKDVPQGAIFNDNVDDNTSDSSSDSSSSDGEEGEGRDRDKPDNVKHGISNEFDKLRKKKGELHRKHRGLMQWRVARNLAWVGRGIEHTADKLGDKITGGFHHKDAEIGIEKEV